MAIIRSDTLTLQVTSADQQQALANTLALYRRLVRDLMTVAYPGCCTGSVRSPQMPGSVGIKGIWGGVWLFFDQVPVLRAHLPPPPCLFCAGDSTPRRYPGTSLLANIRKRSCSGYWLFNISRMVRG